MTSPNSVAAAKAENQPQSDPGQRLWRRIQSVVFILFCLELGVVLLLFPWSSLWDRNYFFALAPHWASVFFSSYSRGAISGLGVVDLWIAFSEAWRLRGA